MSRLPTGGLIDRTRAISFRFDGCPYQGFAGDTLASALVANDIRLVGRSFKYHRPRGILTAGSEEPNALVTLRSGARAEPNTRATTIELFEGLEATSQNRWPSLGFDLLSINQLAAPLLSAGFYYKTFMWPAAFWERLYEPLIRRAAGLGRLSELPDPDCYDRDHGFCDLLIIGGGPAGLAAALTAGRAKLRVILANEDAMLGGQLLSDQRLINGVPAHHWVEQVIAELGQLPNVRLLNRTNVFGIYDGQEYGAIERITDHLADPMPSQPRQRYWKIIARHALLATGAIERPFVFGGNDRPGVMMASAVSTYLNRFAAVPGKRAVVFTCTDSGWATAADLIRAGVEVAAVIDPRGDVSGNAGLLVPPGTRAIKGSIVDAYGSPVHSVDVLATTGRRERVSSDLVVMAGGWNPAIGLGSNLGGKPVWSDDIHSFLMGTPPPGLVAIGAAAGRFSLAAALKDGIAGATDAIAQSGIKAPAPPIWSVEDSPGQVGAFWHVPAHREKAFVDFQHDVTDSDVALSAREGFRSIEHLKRYTTLGMATDQGKIGQLNAHALMAAATGREIAEVGTIRSRPPYLPVAIGALAGHHRGEHFRPERRTSGHAWAVERGATFVDAGQWKRAQWFATPGETDWRETVNREVIATRNGVGICDVSTLGKIDVFGPDAGTLLDRLYINGFSSLKVGKARYGVMLREDGMVMDDGTTTRLGDEHFYMTTTTANAAKVMQHIDFARQIIWPELDVQATSVTEHWSTYAVAGPQSRAVLQAMFPDTDLSNEKLPFMGAREFMWCGSVARIFRLSFSGELAFEVSVPAALCDRLVRALFETGKVFDVTAYGTEALGVMRIEKGHPAGNELNGQTTAADLGMARMMSTKKDFIGRVMAARPGLVEEDRPTLVGLKPVVPGAHLRAGAHLIAKGHAQPPVNDQGYVTSAAWSPTLGHSIALALLRRGSWRHGEIIIVHDPVRGADVEAMVCDPVFVDPEGVRTRV